NVSRFNVLVNPKSPLTAPFVASLQAAAVGWQYEILTASTNREIDLAFGRLVREHADALLISGDALFTNRCVQLAILAAAPRAARDSRQSRVCRGWRLDELRNGRDRSVSPGWHLHWPRSQRRKARRPSGRTADQARARHQPANGQHIRACCPPDSARARRRGDRIAPVSAAARNVCFWHKADMALAPIDVCFWGNSGHWGMSALPPKADIGTHSRNVRFVPKADIGL